MARNYTRRRIVSSGPWQKNEVDAKVFHAKIDGMTEFGAKLRLLREAKGLSQERLAARIGVARQTVGRWERNVDLPRHETLLAVADELGVTVADLTGGSGHTEYGDPRGTLDVADAQSVEYGMEGFIMVPVFETVPASGFDDAEPVGHVRIEKGQMRGTVSVAYRLTNDRFGRYLTGDVFLVDIDARPRPGSLVIAAPDNGATASLWRFSRKDHHNILTTDNVDAPDWRGSFRVLGVVVDLVHRERNRL